MRRLAVCLVLIGVVAGCSSATGLHSGFVAVTPSKTVYAPGEAVTARLSNGSSSEIGFGACSLRAERRNGAQWELVGPAEVPCTMQLILLGAHNERTLELHENLATPGEYRLRFEFSPHTQLSIGEIAYSPSFSIGFTATQ